MLTTTVVAAGLLQFVVAGAAYTMAWGFDRLGSPGAPTVRAHLRDSLCGVGKWLLRSGATTLTGGPILAGIL